MADNKKEAKKNDGSAIEKQVREQKKIRRKHLDERLTILHQRAMMIEEELRQLDDPRYYRVCIFGSARIKPDTDEYQEVFIPFKLLLHELLKCPVFQVH